MKLYFSPGACSLAPHIVALEAGIPVDLVRVDTRTKKTADGGDYLTKNPKGYVPALELDGGQVLTEGPVIMQYLADRKPESGLVPAAGTMERYRVQEMLGFINSEIHKTYSPLFRDQTPPEVRREREEHLRKRYAIIEAALAGKPYLFGDALTIADAYLYTVTRWAGPLKVDLADLRNLTSFQARVAQRPAVQAALRAESPVRPG
jgi:glutathione S-transferase